MSSRAASKLAGRVAADKRKAASTPRQVSRTQICRALKEHSLTFLRVHFDIMLRDLEDSLFDLAQNSPSNADQTQYLEAMTILRDNRAELMKLIWTEYAQNYDTYFMGKGKAPVKESVSNTEMEFTDLALVDQAVWEDDLAISIMSSRAEQACTQVLWALNRRMSALSGKKLSESEDNPLGPVAFATSIQKAVGNYDITEKAKSSVYAQFNISVLEKIEKFLVEANELLAGKGILPDLKYRAEGSQSSSVPGGGAANSEEYAQADGMAEFNEQASVMGAAGMSAAGMRAGMGVPNAGQGNWHESMRAEQRLLDAIIQWQVQNLAITRTGVTGAGVPLGPIFSADATVGERFNSQDYVSILNNLQGATKQQFENGGGVVTASSVMDFQKEFVGCLNEYAEDSEEEKKMPAADAGTIDLVGTIFNEILEEESLTDNVKALLSHLHTPFLKIALIDKQFMQAADHPARLLLNELAEAAAYWLSDEEDKYKVYDKLYQVVHRMIDDFDAEIDFINQLREDFANFVERLDKRASLAEKRTSQAEEGQDKVELAKKKSLELFHRRAEAKAIPAASRDILERCWVEFLSFVYLRFGADSESWTNTVLMLNQVFVRVHAALIAGDQNLENAAGEAELLEESDALSTQSGIAKIDVQLRVDILELGYAEEDVATMFDLIAKASEVRPEDDWRARYANQEMPRPSSSTEGGIQGIDIGVAASDNDEELQADIKMDFEIPKLDDDLNEQEQALREDLRSVEYGTWFEWLASDGEIEKKLKLAWYSSMSDNYMFVNQGGVKVLVESLNNLTRNVHRGQIRIVNKNNASFMERVFKKIVGNMQSSA